MHTNPDRKKELEQAVLSSLKSQIQLLNNGQSSGEAAEQENTISKNLEKFLFEQFAGGVINREQFVLEKQEIAKRLSEFQTERESLLLQLQSVMQPKQTPGKDLGRYAFTDTKIAAQ